ncbi:MAG TPA: class I SAM-dependent methyltransferase [Anaerolineae bacterium]|nr:class I SAM-dependent methyltransferase [Anaerolineae bacterium]
MNKIRPNIEPFEQHYQKYENWFEDNWAVYESELRAVQAMLPKTGTGIEIGVGTGRFAAPLGIQLGIEPSHKMNRIAQSRGIEVIGGVAEKLPFNNSQFDLVLSVTTICFLNNIEIAFQETRRVLKTGGSFIIGFVEKNSPVGKQYQKYKEENVFYRVATFRSTQGIIPLLKRTGFGNLSFVQTIFHDLTEIKTIEPVKEGHGEGSFVVIRAEKID